MIDFLGPVLAISMLGFRDPGKEKGDAVGGFFLSFFFQNVSVSLIILSSPAYHMANHKGLLVEIRQRFHLSFELKVFV